MTATRRHALSGLSMVMMGGSKVGAAQAQEADATGIWWGPLDLGAAVLRLRLVITSSGATLFSVDQGNTAIPATTYEATAGSIAMAFDSLKARFEGKRDGDTIVGTFTQGRSFPLTFTRGDVPADVLPTAEPLTGAVLDAQRRAAGTPALGALYHRVGGVPMLIAAGLRRADGTEEADEGERWHWGSITKSMTAVLVARMAEAGLVSWDDTVGKVLGSAVPGMVQAYGTATYRHLLSHRAGLQPNLPIETILAFKDKPDADVAAERLRYAALALAQTPSGPPAGAMNYANNGYVVAGAMLERATGVPWESLMQRHVFGPLGINSAGFGPPGARRAGQGFAVGHAAQGAARLPIADASIGDNPAPLGPAGRVHMTLADMHIYLSQHRDRPAAFLTKASWDRLHTPPFGGDYAMGLVVRKDGALWHNGSNTLWYGEVLIDAAPGVVAAVVANDATPATMRTLGITLKSARLAALKA